NFKPFMLPAILKYIIIFLSLLNAGYMAFDGTRALVTGDYIRPKSGEYAGQLGPWTKLVTKIGIDPMSTFMKGIFVLFGLAGLFITSCFALNYEWSWKAMLIFNICCVWNLFFGTVSSILQIILLLILRFIK
ncbi:MAG TPA: hypothetical protein VD905_21065, partial [Flavobacteriales bacterium]|nr:hypothetical protein [Flavobacteriales bacterium]